MSWLQVEFTIPRQVADQADALLAGLGALSVSLADPGAEAILEPSPGATPLWPEVAVTALLPQHTSQSAVLARLVTLPGIAAGDIRFSELADRDWVREFREQLEPRCYAGRLWICPVAAHPPATAAAVVTLEPGLAFGSGSHPTTAMCLDWLAGLDLAGCRVLDWGCGSGVLAIAALALGAHSATAVDIDPQALQATIDNARSNGVAERLRVVHPDHCAPAERYDVVVANILANTLIGLAPILAGHCRSGARVALSGILSEQTARVIAECRPALELHPAEETSGWALLAGTPAERNR